MKQVTNEELFARIVALEGALAYTVTACTINSPEIKESIVNTLKRDAENQIEPELTEAILRVAYLIHSFNNG